MADFSIDKYIRYIVETQGLDSLTRLQEMQASTNEHIQTFLQLEQQGAITNAQAVQAIAALTQQREKLQRAIDGQVKQVQSLEAATRRLNDADVEAIRLQSALSAMESRAHDDRARAVADLGRVAEASLKVAEADRQRQREGDYRGGGKAGEAELQAHLGAAKAADEHADKLARLKSIQDENRASARALADAYGVEAKAQRDALQAALGSMEARDREAAQSGKLRSIQDENRESARALAQAYGQLDKSGSEWLALQASLAAMEQRSHQDHAQAAADLAVVRTESIQAADADRMKARSATERMQAEAQVVIETHDMAEALRGLSEAERSAYTLRKDPVPILENQGKAVKGVRDQYYSWGTTVLFASQMIEDAQYGFSAVVNNLGMVSLSLARQFGFSTGAAAGLAGGIGVLGVVINQSIPMFRALNESFERPKVEDYRKEIDFLKASLKALEEKPHKLDLDYKAIDEAEKTMARLQKELAGFDSLAKQKASTQEQAASVVKDAIVEFAGAGDRASGAENIAQVLKQMRMAGGTYYKPEDTSRLGGLQAELAELDRELARPDPGGTHGRVAEYREKVVDSIARFKVEMEDAAFNDVKATIDRAAEGDNRARTELLSRFQAPFNKDAFAKAGITDPRFAQHPEQLPEGFVGPPQMLGRQNELQERFVAQLMAADPDAVRARQEEARSVERQQHQSQLGDALDKKQEQENQRNQAAYMEMVNDLARKKAARKAAEAKRVEAGDETLRLGTVAARDREAKRKAREGTAHDRAIEHAAGGFATDIGKGGREVALGHLAAGDTPEELAERFTPQIARAIKGQPGVTDANREAIAKRAAEMIVQRLSSDVAGEQAAGGGGVEAAAERMLAELRNHDLRRDVKQQGQQRHMMDAVLERQYTQGLQADYPMLAPDMAQQWAHKMVKLQHDGLNMQQAQFRAWQELEQEYHNLVGRMNTMEANVRHGLNARAMKRGNFRPN
jgi:hypothetical protein